MAKKIYFYTVDLHDKSSNSKCDYHRIKDLFIQIIENNTKNADNFKTLDLTENNSLHCIADIFEYNDHYLFMRLSNQKPSGSYLYRNYSTNIPDEILKNSTEDKEGIEIYTYIFLDYETGILSIVKQLNAPSIQKINQRRIQ